MKIHLALFLTLPLAHADFTEDFDGGWNDPSYSGISTFNTTSGTWESQDSLVESQSARSGDCVRMNRSGSPYLEYKGLDGNGHDGGIDTITFWFRHWDGDGSTIEFNLEYNADNAGWTNAASGTCDSTTYQQFSHTLNLSGDNIRLRIIPTDFPERLIIDDFALTSGGGNPPTPGISFQTTSSTSTESDGTLQIPVTISPPANASVTVAVTGGTVESNDYTLNTSSLTFTTGAPTQNISLSLTDDSSVEPDETLILTLSNPTGANLGDDTHTLTITDNDTPSSNGETLVIVSANTTSGNFQQYEGPGDRIFQAIDADIIGIQEFNVPGDDIDGWVDATFGTEFEYSIEPGDEQIPCGVISRYPIIASGEFIDNEVSNRDFAWATIDIPGTIDLHVISVHFLTSGSGVRNDQATNLIANVNATFPSTDYIVLCGDFNSTSRNATEINTLKQVFKDTYVPVDQNGNSDTNANRNNPYDWVMPNATLDALHSTYSLNGLDFPNGLVFDTRVWPSNNVPSPALPNDSGASNMQHMAVIKAYTLPVAPTPPGPITIESCTFDVDTNTAQLTFQADPSTAYQINLSSDLTFTPSNFLTPTSASTGTLNGNQITTNTTGQATLQIPLPALPKAFLRVELP
ncbi:MAG: endonuclease/exonuclease/phosphatase family protein [Verrucomicrobiota bacterium]